MFFGGNILLFVILALCPNRISSASTRSVASTDDEVERKMKLDLATHQMKKKLGKYVDAIEPLKGKKSNQLTWERDPFQATSSSEVQQTPPFTDSKRNETIKTRTNGSNCTLKCVNTNVATTLSQNNGEDKQPTIGTKFPWETVRKNLAELDEHERKKAPLVEMSSPNDKKRTEKGEYRMEEKPDRERKKKVREPKQQPRESTSSKIVPLEEKQQKQSSSGVKERYNNNENGSKKGVLKKSMEKSAYEEPEQYEQQPARKSTSLSEMLALEKYERRSKSRQIREESNGQRHKRRSSARRSKPDESMNYEKPRKSRYSKEESLREHRPRKSHTKEKQKQREAPRKSNYVGDESEDSHNTITSSSTAIENLRKLRRQKSSRRSRGMIEAEELSRLLTMTSDAGQSSGRKSISKSRTMVSDRELSKWRNDGSIGEELATRSSRRIVAVPVVQKRKENSIADMQNLQDEMRAIRLRELALNASNKKREEAVALFRNQIDPTLHGAHTRSISEPTARIENNYYSAENVTKIRPKKISKFNKIKQRWMPNLSNCVQNTKDVLVNKSYRPTESIPETYTDWYGHEYRNEEHPSYGRHGAQNTLGISSRQLLPESSSSANYIGTGGDVSIPGDQSGGHLADGAMYAPSGLNTDESDIDEYEDEQFTLEQLLMFQSMPDMPNRNSPDAYDRIPRGFDGSSSTDGSAPGTPKQITWGENPFDTNHFPSSSRRT
ncbi:hypothetical protein niasHT_039204 [Heterodera trifolii]|uniref:Uncharacterized protein n=1 Tax=Heterodera trifolii TaxID=157864 RepID=A0ABD2IKE8_9BILA